MGYIDDYMKEHPDVGMDEFEITIPQYTLDELQYIADDLGWTISDVIAAIANKDIVTYPDKPYECRL